jgi:hypothetical protein
VDDRIRTGDRLDHKWAAETALTFAESVICRGFHAIAAPPDLRCGAAIRED